jgi:hypothetical protein
MANIRMAVAARNAMLDALNARINLGAGAGTIRIYSGTQPTDGDTALGAQTLLATLTFSDPAAPAAATGVLTFSTITEDSAADAAATATWARIQDSTGANVLDGDVGTSGALINLNTTTIAANGPVRISSFTITLPATMTF